MTTDCIIFDIDGTLADCRHRLHHVNSYPKNWEAFFDAIPDDIVIEPIRLLLMACSISNIGVVLCSGRPEDRRAATVEWLNRVGVDETLPLYMRPVGDSRQDAIVKLELLERMRADGYNPILAIDDRPQVIEAWRGAGILVLAVLADHANSDEATQYKGETLLTVMVGPSGAGKSRWCENNTHPGSVISSDQIRAELTGDFRDQSQNDRVFRTMHDVARCRLRNGLSVVLDATHLRRKDRMSAAALAPKGTNVRYVVVERDIEARRETGGWRNEVPGLIDKHDQTFRSQIKDIMAGDNLSNVTVIHVSDN